MLRLRRWAHDYRVGIGFVILAVSVSVALYSIVVLVGRNNALVQRVDAKDNATRCAVVTLVGQLSINSERNARAQLASPTATTLEKKTAQQNLDRILALKKTTEDALGNPTKCGGDS